MNALAAILALASLAPFAAGMPFADHTGELVAVDESDGAAPISFPHGVSDPAAALRLTDAPDAGLAAIIAGFAQRQGLLPPATSQGSPGTDYRWARATGDVDGDGQSDVLVTSYHFKTLRGKVTALSGADQRELWSFDNGFTIPSHSTLAPRRGLPRASLPDTAQGGDDLNGDGAPDAVVFRYAAQGTLPQEVAYRARADLVRFDAALVALDGRNGAPLWTEPLPAVFAYEQWDPAVILIKGLPTGWAYFQSPDGPRVVHKTTDVVLHATYDPTCLLVGCVLGAYVQDRLVTEQVRLLDATTGARIWERTILPNEDPKHTAITWITGVAQLGAGAEPDIVLDQWLEHRPQYSEPRLLDEPAVNYGRAMRMMALDGASGTSLWSTIVFEEPAVRANLPVEEAYEQLAWTGGQILGDLNGDGVHDPVALYETVDFVSPATTNGRFRAHVIPLDGAGGAKIWPDQKLQGWGFAASLATSERNPGLLAMGTVDFAVGGAAGGKFPPKDIHLAIYDVKQKVAVWTYSYRFAQDNFLPYELSLQQYLTALAPHDWDQDGVLDVVTPAQYILPGGANQTLLATTKHRYQIFSGLERTQLAQFTVWGPLGIVSACAYEDGDLGLFVGHSRRIDFLRVDPMSPTEETRQPIYFDAKPRPATAGVNLVFLGTHCDTSQGGELLSTNLETVKLQPSDDGPFETATESVLTQLAPDGSLLWMDPPLPTEVPLGASLLEPLPPLPAPWWTTPSALIVPAGVMPGVAVGVGLRMRRRPGGGLK